MNALLMVALGGALGASGRYLAGSVIGHFWGGAYPWATFAVNSAGSFLLGLLAGLMAFAWTPSPEMRLFLTVGVLGGFTTFSAFSLELVLLLERGRADLAALYLVSTLAVAVGGLFAGLRLARLVA